MYGDIVKMKESELHVVSQPNRKNTVQRGMNNVRTVHGSSSNTRAEACALQAQDMASSGREGGRGGG